MKKSKASNLDDGFDFISNMPDPILQLILQGLPTTEEVVRTSILSTRWRYLWTSLPHFPSLNIDSERVLNHYIMFSKKKFKDFVSWCLADKTRDLDSFRLCCATYYKVSTVEAWIKAAIMRKVKSLDLTYCPKSENEDITLPHYVISCDSLEVLRLCLCRRAFHFPADYESLWFRALRVLKLESVYCYDKDLVKPFTRFCPLLEELTLIDCFVKVVDTIIVESPKIKILVIRNCKDMYSVYNDLWSNVDVSCPELVNFEFVGRRGEIVIDRAASLKKAVILPEVISERNLSPNLGKIFCELLAGISHVASLSINFYFIQCINIARDREKCFPASFPDLKTLEVTTSIDAFTMDVLLRFLKCSPNLESLNLIIQKEHLGTEHWALDKPRTRLIITRHLKRVKFIGFSGEKQKLDIARCLLKHETALEEMCFSWCSEVKYHEKSVKMVNILSKFCKASSTVKLISFLEDQ